jgi:hypothetical protein
MYHGDWWGGGYGAWARSPWLSEPPLKLFFDWYLSQCALQVPVLMMFSLLLLARGRRGLDLLIQPAAVLLVIAAFFSIYAPSIGQDPIRRLSVTWLGFGLAVGLAWPGFGLTRFATAGFAALNLLVGVYWFQLGEFNHYPRPGGFFYPLVIWVTWLVKGRSPILYGGYVLACVLIGGLAAFKLARLFRADCEPPLPASVRKSVTSH